MTLSSATCRLAALALLLAAGCGGPSAVPELVWGKRGIQPGDQQYTPRAQRLQGSDDGAVLQ